MRIAIDTTAMPERRAGAGVYTYHLTRAIAEALPESDRLLILDRWGAFHDTAAANVQVEQVDLRERARRTVWEQTTLPQRLHRWSADVFHSPHHSLPAIALGWRSVVTVHDITFRLLPWRYTRARRWYMHVATLLAARRAAHIIVPSRSVQRDFARRYRTPRNRITVVHEAPPPSMRPVADHQLLAATRQRLGLPERFLLSVGTLEPGKNRDTLFQALASLRAQGHALDLVIAGQRGWLVDERDETLERLGLTNAVHYTGYVPDTDLPLLYNLAEVFVFPSWREGFGLPPLEAMACGLPVVASDRPAMPEILGDAALYAPPDAPAQWAAQIALLARDKDHREHLRSAGLARAALYSWQRAARETLDVYRAIAGH